MQAGHAVATTGPTAADDALFERERASWEKFRQRYAERKGLHPDALATTPWVRPADQRPDPCGDTPNELVNAHFEWENEERANAHTANEARRQARHRLYKEAIEPYDSDY